MSRISRASLPIFNNQTPLLALAPMEGLTNPLVRELIIKAGGVDLVATEFIRITGVKQKITPPVRHSVPLQIQLMGASACDVVGCFKRLKDQGVILDDDYLDLNTGCPSRRVMNKGAGAGILKRLDCLSETILGMRAAHSGPLSLKTRTGYATEADFNALIDTLKSLPLDFITMHARFGVSSYSDPVQPAFLKQAVKALPFPVIGNGDIWTARDAVTMLKESCVKGIMCGRGALANPFIFNDIRNELKEAKVEINPQERSEELLNFALEFLEHYVTEPRDSKIPLGPVKEFFFWFSKNPLIGKQFFHNIKRLQSVAELKERLLTRSFL